MEEARWVVLGAVEYLTEEGVGETGKEVVSVVERVRYPGFQRWAHLHDIGLLRLERRVPFTEAVRPACLNTRPPVPSHLTATGWGTTQYGSGNGSKWLMKVTLEAVPDCDKYFRMMREGIPPSILCSGHLEGGKDTCQGDSGGPLQVIEECKFSQLGITSTGGYCGFANSPALYTNVAYYTSWIEKIVWGTDTLS